MEVTYKNKCRSCPIKSIAKRSKEQIINPKNRFANLLIFVALIFGGDAAIGADTIKTELRTQSEEDQKEDIIPLEDIRILVEVFHKIKKDYIEPISDKDLLENAVRGMLAGLDPHSSYLDAEGYVSLQQGTTGEFGGLGIEVGTEDGFLKVIAPIDDTPAQRAGVQAGDVIVRLDDTPVKGLSLNEAVKIMRGKAGTPITLSIIRDGENKPLEIQIVRAVIKIQSVKARFLEPGFAYIRVSAFQSRTGTALEKKIADLKNKTTTGLKGVILDMRNNPGGVLGAAVAVSDAFLNEGLIVYTDGRAQDAELEFNAKPPDLIAGTPLVVLINEGSASASEIVAGALQDQKRAIIMGRRSFGKGSVQTILPMNNDAALKLTTARYYTPSGRSIQAEGIVPDILIDKLKLSPIAISGPNIIKEKNLTGHLENEAEHSAETNTAKPKEYKNLAASDFELYEALNLLKGMDILQVRSSGD
ncbi:MAG TPA: peptidase S41 [Gammaproteobacteria bacterium]|nr:peptidase S41 [Gammaproteobacteria bacterium]|tara:strand:+ start:165 stop:1583 length:1419 start_codon:yes stop_codon:yes gene_type:complete